MEVRKSVIHGVAYGNILCLAIFMAGLGLFMTVMPKYSDDLWYMVRLYDWFTVQGVTDPTSGGDIFKYGLPWSRLWETYEDHCRYDTGRVCNLAAMLSLLLPKWVGSGFALLCWFAAVACSLRLAGTCYRTPVVVPVAVLMWTFGMPWSQQMGALDYQFNYVVSSALVLWYVGFVFGSKRAGGWRPVLIFLAGCAAGCWHEGFALPVLVGLCAVMLFFDRERTSANMAAAAGLAAGLLLLALIPATAVRLMAETAGKQYGAGVVAVTLLTHPVFLVFITFWVCLLFKKESRRSMIRPLPIFVIASAVAAILMQILVTQTRRTGWWADLISVVGLLVIVREFILPAVRERRMVCTAVTAVSAVCVTAYWATVDLYAVRISGEYREVISELVRKKDDPRVFATTTGFDQLPWYCLNTPDMGILRSPESLAAIKHYYRLADYPAVIPRELEYASGDSGQPLTEDGNIRIHDGCLFGRPDCHDYSVRTYDCDFGRYGIHSMSFCLYSFRSRRDGMEYMYIYPRKNVWPLKTADIKKIKSHG